MIAAIAVVVLAKHIRGAEFAAALAQLRGFSMRQLWAAFGLVMTSIALGGIYEAIAVRASGPSLGLVRPLTVATIANAVGHTLGFSTLSGGALRYRFYSGLGLGNAHIGAIVVLSAMPFLLGSLLLLSLALVHDAQLAARALRIPTDVSIALGCAGLGLSLAYLVLTALHRRSIAFGKFSFKLPSLPLALQQFVFGAAEIPAVAGVLYVFMPAQVDGGFFGFLFAYLIAVLVAQLSSVPAGLGVLEASLVLLLPQVPADQLIDAVIAYRVMFEVLPVIIAFALFADYELRRRDKANAS